MINIKKVAAYCRVSTDKDDQANSLENQKEYFERYIKGNKDWEFVNIYADEGISGTSIKNRVEFQNMLSDSYNGKIDIILVKEISRFFRNTPRLIDYIRELKRCNVEVRFTTEGLSTFDSNAEFTISVLASTAQQESNKISIRTKWGQKRSMEKGIVFGNGLLGYKVEQGKLYINENEAEIVKKIFNDYTNKKMGMYTIAKDLMNKGYKTSKGKTQWTPSGIRTILNNEKYCGDLIQQKTYTEDYLTHRTIINKGEQEFVYLEEHHEPIITRELFEKTKEELKVRGINNKNSGNRYSNQYAFSGKIKCGNCGKNYSAGTKKTLKSGEIIMQWRCYTRATNGKKQRLKNGKTIGCDGISMQDNILKEGFNSILTEVLKNSPEIEKKAITMVNKIVNRRCKKDDRENRIINRQKEIEKEKDKVIELYTKELISEEDFIKKKMEREKILESIKNELNEIRKKDEIMENKPKLIKEIKKQVEQILDVKEFNNEMCREILDKIVIHNRSEIDYYIKGIQDKFFFDNLGGLLYGKSGLITKY